MNFDAVVLGTGGVGSATMFHLAKSGLRVLGLDRFPPGHVQGSSHGETRVIRKSYFEHPGYVPLLQTAYTLWDELGEACGQRLLHRTGIVYFAAPNGVVIQGILQSAEQHQIEVQELSVTAASERFPYFVAPAGTTAIFEPDAGYLLVERCVTAHIEQAVQLGAVHRHGEVVTGWSATNQGIGVETDKGRYEAGKLVITAGCWTNDLLAGLNIPLRIVRKHLHWYAVNDDGYQASHGCPCYFFETDGGYFYGCPALNASGLKVAEHSGGTEIIDPLTDPSTRDDNDRHRIETFLAQHLPGVSPQSCRHERCFYTVTPDEHFVVDHHPEHENVVFAAGLSGHGFKFASALGLTLANMTIGRAPMSTWVF